MARLLSHQHLQCKEDATCCVVEVDAGAMGFRMMRTLNHQVYEYRPVVFYDKALASCRSIIQRAMMLDLPQENDDAFEAWIDVLDKDNLVIQKHPIGRMGFHFLRKKFNILIQK